MFNIGFSEIIVILILVLLVIGPKKMPEIARIVGRGYREFRKASDDLQSSLREDAVETLKNNKETSVINRDRQGECSRPAFAGHEQGHGGDSMLRAADSPNRSRETTEKKEGEPSSKESKDLSG